MAATSLDTGTRDLLADLDAGLLTITLNRPKARNALSEEMLVALSRQLASAELDPNVKCVVITGAGQGFCAGGDVKGMNDGDSSGGRQATLDELINSQRVNQRATAGMLFKMPKPTIAALPGAAAGAGLALALACDLRIMATTAIMTTAFARVGFSGDYGGTYFMSQLVGSAKARELYYLSERVSAEEALRLGLTNWICQPDQLMAKTREVATRLVSGPTIAFRYMKENLNRAMAGQWDDCMDLEATHHVHCGQTVDHKEAAKGLRREARAGLHRALTASRARGRLSFSRAPRDRDRFTDHADSGWRSRRPRHQFAPVKARPAKLGRDEVITPRTDFFGSSKPINQPLRVPQVCSVAPLSHRASLRSR